MKLDIRAFIIAFTAPLALVMLVISIWSRVSLHFGTHFMHAYNSIHPHPFDVSITGLIWWEHLIGTGLDVLYMVVDSVILAGFFVLLYNRLLPSGNGSTLQEKETK